MIGPDGLLIDLVFNSEIAGIDDLALVIVALAWDMFVHMSDNLMAFAFYCVFIFLHMPASTIIFLQVLLHFRMFRSYLLLYNFDPYLYCVC